MRITTPLLLCASLTAHLVSANDVLKTNGFAPCITDADIKVDKVDVTYDRTTQKVTFDAAGSSLKIQKVMANLRVTAYGKEVYNNEFDPCAEDTKVDQLCPVPKGNFAAQGEQSIPPEVSDMIPAIAFAVPDLDGTATLELKSKDSGETLGCIESHVGNGKTLKVPAVSYVAAGMAGAALVLTGLSAIGAAGHPGATTSSPGFTEVIGWFQSIATNGMLSVNYPSVYRSFSKNFAFSGGIIPWDNMQKSIDSFRNSTGGNLTSNSYEFLQHATLVFPDNSTSQSTTAAKRAVDVLANRAFLLARDINTSVNETSEGSAEESDDSTVNHMVDGIQSYVEQLSIPQANTFMTVLLVFAIVIGAIAVGILLLKVILETWALFGSFPPRLTSFRKDYWGLLARTITNLILVLYGVWTLYCVFQFTRGDSWAAITLAAVTLAMFTGVLAFFTFRIWQLARKYKKSEGDTQALYEDRETWRKYSLFYDNYKKGYWWIFVPTIIYMFVRGCIIAGGDGHGLFQSAGQLAVEGIMLVLLLWSRPYETKSGQWINIAIQVVRVLSVACILVFVQELGISETTKTVTGVVLIAIQSTLTALLAILIAVNAIILCCRENPHAKRRKEAEKSNHDLDNLTTLDARNSLMGPPPSKSDNQEMSKFNFTGPYEPYRDHQIPKSHKATESTDHLIPYADDSVHHQRSRSASRDSFGRGHSPEPPLPGMARY
ncbi:hypothetical protein FQN54_000982 [Arachnomyces sp. PD_36]|nr:hypothetical protein FQN54_000982 [Arachnomyces sp. PD_36]